MFLKTGLFSNFSRPFHGEARVRWEVFLRSQQVLVSAALLWDAARDVGPLGLSLLSCQMEELWSDGLESGWHTVDAH